MAVWRERTRSHRVPGGGAASGGMWRKTQLDLLVGRDSPSLWLIYCSVAPGSLLSHLVQGGLGHGVVFDGQPAPIPVELAENVGQSAPCVGQLVLQRVVMLLLQDAAGELLLDKVLHRLQHRRAAADPHDHRVAVTEPAEPRLASVDSVT